MEVQPPWLPWEDEEAVRAFFEGAADVAGRSGVHTLKIKPEVYEEAWHTFYGWMEDTGQHASFATLRRLVRKLPF